MVVCTGQSVCYVHFPGSYTVIIRGIIVHHGRRTTQYTVCTFATGLGLFFFVFWTKTRLELQLQRPVTLFSMLGLELYDFHSNGWRLAIVSEAPVTAEASCLSGGLTSVCLGAALGNATMASRALCVLCYHVTTRQAAVR